MDTFSVVDLARTCITQKQTRTKEHFKQMLKSRLEIMLSANDDAPLTQAMRQIARYNPEYIANDGDNRTIEYGPHPNFATTMTICIFINGFPVSVGWNMAINQVWNEEIQSYKKRQREQSKPAPVRRATSKMIDENTPRGPGQLFRVGDNSTFSEYNS